MFVGAAEHHLEAGVARFEAFCDETFRKRNFSRKNFEILPHLTRTGHRWRGRDEALQGIFRFHT